MRSLTFSSPLGADNDPAALSCKKARQTENMFDGVFDSEAQNNALS